MGAASSLEIERLTATDGNIAAINLQSAREQSWGRFWRTPERPGIAELIVEQEQLTAQFSGDLAAFERLELLASEFSRVQAPEGRGQLIAAQVACSTHRFAEARATLARAVERGAPAEATDRLALGIDQATGTDLQAVLARRRERVAQGRWEERIPLAALLVDLGQFDEAERIYLQALREYPDVSPFAPAWVCFQLGVLWGECVPAPNAQRAAQWYRMAVDYLPCYVKARVHLAEICLDGGDLEQARALLTPAIECGDPEVSWRLADVAHAAGDAAQAASQLAAARAGFQALLARHRLAFADHGAEFYAGSGGDPVRAFELARLNLGNRPTLRAFEQAHATALAAGELAVAEILLARAVERWANTAAFDHSPLRRKVTANAGT
jgi:tetratricopeptide (TPR) repeat protein